MKRLNFKTRTTTLALATVLLAVPVFAGSAMAAPRDRDNGRIDRRQVDNRRDRTPSHWSHNDRDNNRGRITALRHNDNDRSRFGFGIRFGTSSPTYCTTPAVVTTGGYWTTQYVPATYVTRYDPCGRPYSVLVSPEHYEQVWVPITTTVCEPTCHDNGGLSISFGYRR